MFFAKHLSAYAFMRPRVVGKRVLELGFGDGYGTAYLAEQAQEVAGVDTAPGNIPLAQAKYRLGNVSFELFDGLHLPFPDASFDAAGTFQVIEHVPEDQLVLWLAEIRRVLKREGALYVSTLNLEQAQKPGGNYEKHPEHQKEFTGPELEALLKEIFPKVTLYGLYLTPKHQLLLRVKKWGLHKLFGATDQWYFDQIGVEDFAVRAPSSAGALDLIAVCQKE